MDSHMTEPAAEASIRSLTTTCEELTRLVEQANRQAMVAEVASHAKTEFLARVSHVMRTSMTAILGFTDNLLDPSLSQEDRLEAVRTIKRNGEHLIELISDILDLSQIEAGKLAVNHAVCSPFQIVADVQSRMNAHALAKGLRLDVDFIGDLPETIQTDPERLRQILLNLIGNAIEFTETGGVRLVIHFSDEGLEPLLRFEVIDTGMGMDSDQLASVFDPFATAAQEQGHWRGKSGLGLSISKLLAGLLGGDLTVESAPEVGTTCRLKIATGPLDGVAMVDGAENALIVRNHEYRLRARDAEKVGLGARILLAEDGPDNQRLLSFVLRKAGAEVVVAENGRVAVDLAMAAEAGGQPFSLVLMDMQMPVLDGYSATSLWRMQGYSRPIIAVTAHAMAGDRERCLSAGCDDYTSKPIDRLRLVEVVRTWLDRAPRHESAVSS